MKVWVTRPSIWDCLVKGIGRCELWFVQPHFDASPRGESDIAPYRHLPRGWRALDEDGSDIRGIVSLPVGNTLKGHPVLAQGLWRAVCVSIEGRDIPEPDDLWVQRWEQLMAADCDTGDTSFLFEMELPPDLWFKIALFNGFENGTWASRHYRYLLEVEQDGELPF